MRNKSENEEGKKYKRIWFLGNIVTIILLLLIIRLYLIQIVDGEKYSELTQRQYQYRVNHVSSRGTIYDRNMQPLTNVEDTTLLFVDNSMINDQVQESMKHIAEEDLEILGENQGTRYRILRVNDQDHEAMSNLLASYFTYPLQLYKRYYDYQPAAHIIGYVNQWDNKGAVGLEKSFESILNSSQPEIYATVDGVNNIIPGLGFQVNNVTQPNRSIVTTLDIKIQKKIEEILKENNQKGSAIVLEAGSGDILACANYPAYNPNRISLYLESDNEELFNRAVQVGYPPGSIFKIVVAAAALESGIVDEDTSFFCKGYEEINDVKIKCTAYKRGGHGSLNLEDAFCHSCNAAFIQLGIQTGSEAILEMSKKFGVGNKTGIRLDEEYVGNLPTADEVKGAGIGNLSVGQGELLVTPLQIARLTAIIANNGIDYGINLVQTIIDHNDTTTDISNKIHQRMISRDTAEILGQYMKKTVEEGTADNLGKIFSWEAAGKTGSAQSVYKNKEVTHAWFTGYIPYQNPEYIITVFMEDGKSGRQAAVPVCKKIAEALYNEYYKEPVD